MKIMKPSKKTRQTSLSSHVVLITPQIAENYLKFNQANRKMSEKNVRFLSSQMTTGEFAENGESIIFDRNGELKDGQHRLAAIVKSGKSYFMAVVRGVKPSAMSTIDTGKARSPGDVLNLNGFDSGAKNATLIKSIHRYLNGSKASRVSAVDMSNQKILEYCQDNYDWLKEIIKKADNLYSLQVSPVLSRSVIGLLYYVVGGETPEPIHDEFMMNIVGVKRGNSSAIDYLFKKFHNSKLNRRSIDIYDTTGLAIKAWNYYINGNPEVKFFKFDKDKQEYPKVSVWEKEASAKSETKKVTSFIEFTI
jgi:hypothetical protein